MLKKTHPTQILNQPQKALHQVQDRLLKDPSPGYPFSHISLNWTAIGKPTYHNHYYLHSILQKILISIYMYVACHFNNYSTHALYIISPIVG